MTNKSPAIDDLTVPASVYLGLGSNLGDRESNLHEAIERIQALGLEVTRASSIYKTEPVGYANQPWFLNQVIEVRVDLGQTPVFEPRSQGSAVRASDREEEVATGMLSLSDRVPGAVARFWILVLLDNLLEIENVMGRERTIPNGPRPIDIDILIYGDVQGSFAITGDDPIRSGTGSPWLCLPHPRMHLRRFVLEPLCEIAPEVMHPVLEKTCREILATLEDASTVSLAVP